jgi:hypothetical protein
MVLGFFLWGYVKDIVYKTPVTSLFLWVYVEDIVYKAPMTSLDESKLRIVAAIGKITPQMLENT